MKRQNIERVHIIGSVGSGKTTLAKETATRLGVPHYELDNVMWERQPDGDRRRTEAERRETMNTIIQTGAWVIEGVHNDDWMADSFHQADLIILLDTPYSIRTYRIIKRFMLQKLGIEKSNYKPTAKIFMNMFKWNRDFENEGKPRFMKRWGIYQHKVRVIKDSKEMNKYWTKQV